MRINKIQNSNFSQHSNAQKPLDVQQTASNEAKNIPANRQLVTLQPTEYKKFHSITPRHSNPFLAQYIDQSSQRRTRGFIGRKPAWQAKKPYENTHKILEYGNISHLDKVV